MLELVIAGLFAATVALSIISARRIVAEVPRDDREYMDPAPRDMHAALNTVDVPLNRLNEKELCPGSAALEKINASLR